MLKHQKIIVTGGSSGIGAAAVKLFIELGASVHNFDRQNTKNDRAIFHAVDIRDKGSIQNEVAKITAKGGRIDGAFLSAGIYLARTIEDTSDSELSELIDTNIKGNIFALQAILPVMKSQKAGSIVLTGSDQTFRGKGKSAVYGLTKAAIGQLAQSTAVEYAPHNIRVNCVCPGATATPLYTRSIQEFADRYGNGKASEVDAAVKSRYPMGRIGTPEEVAAVVAFMLSDQSRFVTGALIPVDGGFTA